jgi:hypothetical protein
MQNKYCVINENNKIRLFYKGVELGNILYWEARHPNFHNITFTAEGDFVEFKIDSSNTTYQTTEEVLVELLLAKDEQIAKLQKEVERLGRSHEYGRAIDG